MNAPRHPMGRLGPLAALVLAGALPAGAEPVRLTVGQGQAWVREFFPPSGEKEIDRLVWTNPPAQIDLDTLQVWNVRRPWPVREWRWLAAAPAAADAPPVVWRPRREAPPPAARNRLEIRFAQPLSHAMGHSLTYRLPDFGWSAFYRVVVRGIGPESIEAVQVDLAGYLRIRNGTAAAYPRARVSIVGTDEALQPPPKPFGLLDLNPDTALTDRWLMPTASAPLVPAVYPLQTEAAIPPAGFAEIQFAYVVRKPAQIAHVCDSDEIPAPTRQGGLPLRRVLLVPNIAAMGLGFPLPPGEAQLFLGAARGAPFQTGHARHTPFPGTLQLDLGLVETVRASRQTLEEKPLPDGARQADYSIALANDLASPVRIQVIEKPATPMQWSLVRSSLPCTETTRSLQFDLTLPPRSTQTITYRLRLAAGKQT
ncbi:MAG: hypothetical protein AB7V22_00350 [Kiritimatiellia bacterium]